MDTYIRLTATATLLIGLQLFSIGKVCVAAQPSQSANSHPDSAIEAAVALGQHLVPVYQAQDPEPRPKPPTTTRGGGTRWQ